MSTNWNTYDRDVWVAQSKGMYEGREDYQLVPNGGVLYKGMVVRDTYEDNLKKVQEAEDAAKPKVERVVFEAPRPPRPPRPKIPLTPFQNAVATLAAKATMGLVTVVYLLWVAKHLNIV